MSQEADSKDETRRNDFERNRVWDEILPPGVPRRPLERNYILAMAASDTQHEQTESFRNTISNSCSHNIKLLKSGRNSC